MAPQDCHGQCRHFASRSIIQEIIDRPGWSAGNALSIIIGGTGRRTAEAYDGGPAPVLRVQYASPGTEVGNADLEISIADPPVPVLLGQTVTYTTTITNYGPATATGVSATGTLPTCSIGSLLSGTSATCSAQLTANSLTLAAQSMAVAGIEQDPDLTNNSASATTTVRAPDLVPEVLSAALSGLAGSTKAIVFQLESLTDVQWQRSGEVVI